MIVIGIHFAKQKTKVKKGAIVMKNKNLKWNIFLVLTLVSFLILTNECWSAEGTVDTGNLPWWIWPFILFVFTFIIGIIAPMSGVGGGVLFVPLCTAFFPFSIDFIRGAGLIMALTSALSSLPELIKKRLANIKIMAPIVCISMITSILGGIVGIWITNAFPKGKYYITIALGLVLFVIFIVMLTSKRVEFPEVKTQDSLSKTLDLKGDWFEPSLNKTVEYKITRLPVGIIFFALVGFIAGMFGLGAGWANVPVLNLVMGAPIKIATSTSMAIISVNDAAAAWIYISKGAVLPVIVIPSIIGISIGARIGARLAVRVKPAFVKYLVMAIMLLAAVLNIFKGIKGLM